VRFVIPEWHGHLGRVFTGWKPVPHFCPTYAGAGSIVARKDYISKASNFQYPNDRNRIRIKRLLKPFIINQKTEAVA
jgi:hypothetical protein